MNLKAYGAYCNTLNMSYDVIYFPFSVCALRWQRDLGFMNIVVPLQFYNISVGCLFFIHYCLSQPYTVHALMQEKNSSSLLLTACKKTSFISLKIPSIHRFHYQCSLLSWHSSFLIFSFTQTSLIDFNSHFRSSNNLNIGEQ